MTIQPKHNKVITVAGEVLKTFLTLAIYAAIICLVFACLLVLSVQIGEWVHVMIGNPPTCK